MSMTNDYHTFARVCWKGGCYRKQEGYVRAWWTVCDFISYATCVAHVLEGFNILADRTVDGAYPVIVEWSDEPWAAEIGSF